mmetsp:Transcript_56640/g.168570  ORF Transcript_56640/g.168570 Transcript_56640/m.168570 type:complete len:213 (-) Transcript_56640:193-831(-)
MPGEVRPWSTSGADQSLVPVMESAPPSSIRWAVLKSTSRRSVRSLDTSTLPAFTSRWTIPWLCRQASAPIKALKRPRATFSLSPGCSDCRMVSSSVSPEKNSNTMATPLGAALKSYALMMCGCCSALSSSTSLRATSTSSGSSVRMIFTPSSRPSHLRRALRTTAVEPVPNTSKISYSLPSCVNRSSLPRTSTAGLDNSMRRKDVDHRPSSR